MGFWLSPLAEGDLPAGPAGALTPLQPTYVHLDLESESGALLPAR